MAADKINLSKLSKNPAAIHLLENNLDAEPIICKRRVFKYAGYETYLINEYCTSKLCNQCHQELDNFFIRKSPKEYFNE